MVLGDARGLGRSGKSRLSRVHYGDGTRHNGLRKVRMTWGYASDPRVQRSPLLTEHGYEWCG